MTETERLLRRQAEWQRQRQNLSWPEKIRQAEQLRGTLEVFRAQRRQHSAATAQPAQPETGVPPEAR
jgi:hypothetical protein